MTWFDPNVAVSCQDWKAESIAPWQLQDDTYANISIEQCQPHPCSFPVCVGLARGTEILFSFKAYGAAALLYSLITTACLLEVSQRPLLSGDMEASMLTVTFMQDKVLITILLLLAAHHTAALGAHSVLRHQLLSWNHFNMLFLSKKESQRSGHSVLLAKECEAAFMEPLFGLMNPITRIIISEISIASAKKLYL